jgi:hypothetical protein
MSRSVGATTGGEGVASRENFVLCGSRKFQFICDEHFNLVPGAHSSQATAAHQPKAN